MLTVQYYFQPHPPVSPGSVPRYGEKSHISLSVYFSEVYFYDTLFSSLLKG